MGIPFFQIDAFATRPFEGNQACVMPLEAYLPDEVLQSIAAENNVAETAFIVSRGNGEWDLRWFTPAIEVPLCGHATLAAAHVLFNHLGHDGEQIRFHTRQSGELIVSRGDERHLDMDFPAPAIEPTDVTDEMERVLGVRPVAAYHSGFLGLVLADAESVEALRPDMTELARLGGGARWGRGNVGVMAPGTDTDVVSRFFAPGSGIDEDPATGSWHCEVAAIWADRTGQPEAKCRQAYPGRGAIIATRLIGDRVILTGQSVTVIEGVFQL